MMQIFEYEAILSAIEAGKAIMGHYRKVVNIVYKEDQSPLTEVDLQSHQIIAKRLSYFFSVCSEEEPISLLDRNRGEYYWLIDPLDGTKDFLAQTDDFTVNIALMTSGDHQPIFGVIYAPARNELYFGGEGIGSFRVIDIDGFYERKELDCIRKILPSKQGRNFLIGCDSIFHSTEETTKFFIQNQMHKIKIGSSLKFIALCDGRADIYPRFNGSKEWDTAAGDAILRGIGGIVFDLKAQQRLQYGKENFKNNYFIATPRLKIDGICF